MNSIDNLNETDNKDIKYHTVNDYIEYKLKSSQEIQSDNVNLRSMSIEVSDKDNISRLCEDIKNSETKKREMYETIYDTVIQNITLLTSKLKKNSDKETSIHEELDKLKSDYSNKTSSHIISNETYKTTNINSNKNIDYNFVKNNFVYTGEYVAQYSESDKQTILRDIYATFSDRRKKVSSLIDNLKENIFGLVNELEFQNEIENLKEEYIIDKYRDSIKYSEESVADFHDKSIERNSFKSIDNKIKVNPINIKGVLFPKRSFMRMEDSINILNIEQNMQDQVKSARELSKKREIIVNNETPSVLVKNASKGMNKNTSFKPNKKLVTNTGNKSTAVEDLVEVKGSIKNSNQRIGLQTKHVNRKTTLGSTKSNTNSMNQNSNATNTPINNSLKKPTKKQIENIPRLLNSVEERTENSLLSAEQYKKMKGQINSHLRLSVQSLVVDVKLESVYPINTRKTPIISLQNYQIQSQGQKPRNDDEFDKIKSKENSDETISICRGGKKLYDSDLKIDSTFRTVNEEGHAWNIPCHPIYTNNIVNLNEFGNIENYESEAEIIDLDNHKLQDISFVLSEKKDINSCGRKCIIY